MGSLDDYSSKLLTEQTIDDTSRNGMGSSFISGYGDIIIFFEWKIYKNKKLIDKDKKIV